MFMNDQEKSKEELIIELQQLRQEHDFLKASYEKYFLDLNQAKDRQALLLHSIPMLIYMAEIPSNFSVTWISENVDQITGFKQDVFLEQEFFWSSRLHPEDHDRVMRAFDQLEEHEQVAIEYRWKCANGEYRWFLDSFGSFKKNQSGKTEYTGVWLDITERKLSESIFKDIIEKNPMSIQILNMEGYTIQTNSAHTNLFGVSPPGNYSIFNDRQLMQQGMGNLFKKIKNGEVVYFPDSYFNVHDVDPSFPDSPVWIKAIGFTLNNNNGTPERIVLMHENITERKLAESLLNDIIEKNPMSIQIVDKDGFTIKGNPAYIQLFGTLPPPNFSIFTDLVNKGPELAMLVSQAKNGENVHLPDIYFNAHDAVSEAPDIPLWIRALIFPLKDSSGKPERFVFMHENITERKKAEQELMASKQKAEESDKLKSAFLANMSHEIRTPMNGILGFSELLKKPGLTGEKQQSYIKIIEKSGARMLNILNDIIDISKIEVGLMNIEIKESNINEQLEYVYTFFKPEVEAKGMTLLINNRLPLKEAFIQTDREKLFAILTNLVKNAIKYSDQGTIEFGYTKNGNFLEFCVKDSGIGIKKEKLSVIFERFIQADIADSMARQGAGLGLSITKAYVEMLGGKIWVESTEGVGSRFYFTLPYITESGENCIVPASVMNDGENNAINPGAPGLKILIAEDDTTSELLIETLVERVGKEILKAHTGLEAIECCMNNPDIDLILMDIDMPGVNGYSATKQIRQFNRDVIIIAQTAYGLSGDREKSIMAGCNDYISKPINNDQLMALIQKYFDHQ
jgi:PAS domain S-box-containing protein